MIEPSAQGSQEILPALFEVCLGRTEALPEQVPLGLGTDLLGAYLALAQALEITRQVLRPGLGQKEKQGPGLRITIQEGQQLGEMLGRGEPSDKETSFRKPRVVPRRSASR